MCIIWEATLCDPGRDAHRLLALGCRVGGVARLSSRFGSLRQCSSKGILHDTYAMCTYTVSPTAVRMPTRRRARYRDARRPPYRAGSTSGRKVRADYPGIHAHIATSRSVCNGITVNGSLESASCHVTPIYSYLL